MTRTSECVPCRVTRVLLWASVRYTAMALFRPDPLPDFDDLVIPRLRTTDELDYYTHLSRGDSR